ncbi:hypothetical protein OS190_05900 [Sulfitobacter sp. F26204]|uniref:hypothetical protein n=1 Tax=Sulfitobacter sp. F26204 TaxID=2996014 RepID=UPI00225DF4D6|nr:hypothetical protein [Sulfitobacter sp. F26204]MCX7559094.1 hypothetical protein [Sulfitobacter sp. F26204]
MSFFDVFIDSVKPQTAKDFETVYKVGKALDKMGPKSSAKNVEELQSVLKKGWIEKAEKQIKLELKRFQTALKAKTIWPEEKIDAYEKKVISAYKKESKKGLQPIDCKQTIAAIRPLLKEISRHEQALRDIAYLSKKSIATAAGMEKDYRLRKEYSAELAKQFKLLTKVAVFGAMQAEMLTYYLHCIELKKLYAEAESCAKKLGKRVAEDAKEAKSRAEMTREQFNYTSRSCYWEDLEGRI